MVGRLRAAEHPLGEMRRRSEPSSSTTNLGKYLCALLNHLPSTPTLLLWGRILWRF
jgi:hypothetical protein